MPTPLYIASFLGNTFDRASGAMARSCAGEVLEEGDVGSDGVDGFGWRGRAGVRADPGASMGGGGVGHAG